MSVKAMPISTMHRRDEEQSEQERRRPQEEDPVEPPPAAGSRRVAMARRSPSGDGAPGRPARADQLSFVDDLDARP